MKHATLTIFILVLIQLAVSQLETQPPRKIVCYYTNWAPGRKDVKYQFTPQRIDPFLCTHLIYAFATFFEGKIASNNPKQDIERNGFVDFNDLKKVNERLNTMLSIGGWDEGSAQFSNIARSADKRDYFTQSVIDLLRKYNFNGINIDWQHPTFRPGSRPEDRDNAVELVKSLRHGFEREANLTGQPRMIITMTLPAEREYVEQGYDLKNLQMYVDFFNIVAYNYHLSVEGFIGHHSPLYPLPQEIKTKTNLNLNADASVRFLLDKGIKPEKLNLGIPTYGRTYKLENPAEHGLGAPSKGQGDKGESSGSEVGFITYYELCRIIKEENWTVVHVNRTALGPYAYKGEDWTSYDDEDSARRKAEYARKKGLGGIMFWTIDDDDFRGECGNRSFPVIKAAREGLLRPRREEPTTAMNQTNRPKIPRTGLDDIGTNQSLPSILTQPPMMAQTPAVVRTPVEPQTPKSPLTGQEGSARNTFVTFPTLPFGLRHLPDPTQTPIERVQHDGKGNTFYQTINIWIQNNIFNL